MNQTYQSQDQKIWLIMILIQINIMKNHQNFSFEHNFTGETVNLEMKHRLQKSTMFVAKSLCQKWSWYCAFTLSWMFKELVNGTC